MIKSFGLALSLLFTPSFVAAMPGENDDNQFPSITSPVIERPTSNTAELSTDHEDNSSVPFPLTTHIPPPERDEQDYEPLSSVAPQAIEDLDDSYSLHGTLLIQPLAAEEYGLNNILTIPEVLILICSYLSDGDQASLREVCRALRDIFSPHNRQRIAEQQLNTTEWTVAHYLLKQKVNCTHYHPEALGFVKFLLRNRNVLKKHYEKYTLEDLLPRSLTAKSIVPIFFRDGMSANSRAYLVQRLLALTPEQLADRSSAIEAHSSIFFTDGIDTEQCLYIVCNLMALTPEKIAALARILTLHSSVLFQNGIRATSRAHIVYDLLAVAPEEIAVRATEIGENLPFMSPDNRINPVMQAEIVYRALKKPDVSVRVAAIQSYSDIFFANGIDADGRASILCQLLGLAPEEIKKHAEIIDAMFHKFFLTEMNPHMNGTIVSRALRYENLTIFMETLSSFAHIFFAKDVVTDRRTTIMCCLLELEPEEIKMQAAMLDILIRTFFPTGINIDKYGDIVFKALKHENLAAFINALKPYSYLFFTNGMKTNERADSIWTLLGLKLDQLIELITAHEKVIAGLGRPA